MNGRPLHVHILIDTLATGGAEALLVDFFELAPDYGIAPTVGYLDGGEPYIAERLRGIGVEPELVDIDSLVRKRDRELVRDHLRRVSPDILHTHLTASDLLGGLAARSLGIPFVSTVHSADYATTPRERVKERLMSFVRRNYAYKVVMVSDGAKRRYLADRKDVEGHLVTIRNGIRGEIRPGAGAEVRRELGIDPSATVIAVVGVFRKKKNQAMAAEAVIALSRRFPDLTLLVIGDGYERAAIEAAVAPLGERALLVGFRDDVMDLLDATDLLVHPSAADSLPTALIEGMAASVPSVATQIGGIPEIVVDGETGILFAPPPSAPGLAVATEPLLADPELRRRMGAAARRRFESEFRVERWMEQLARLYAEGVASAS